MMKFKLVKIILLLCLSIFCFDLYAQTKSISIQNIAEVKVDELSDNQIKQFLIDFKAAGYNITQLEQIAIQRKMPTTEFQKLKIRIDKIEQQAISIESDRKSLSNNELNKDKTPEIAKVFDKKVFGAELFNNQNLTFEPNLKIATPVNYQLGPDDELIIDIYGYNEATYKLKVSPEGVIRIPLVGPIQVSGITIEQAKVKIINQLKTIYEGISNGNTLVSITLGNIRSIKVNILGEVNTPGSYTLPSLASVFNALYVSGGPNKNGSFRNIRVIRSGKTVAIVDVYNFLVKGDISSNIRLMDQDVIKVGTYENRIELIGEIKRPAYYELSKGETLKDAINFAGGFTDVAYQDRIKVTRNTFKERSVADVPKEMYSMFIPQLGDKYEVGKIIDRVLNRVEIKGAVFRPGVYALEDGLTLAKLLKKADGLKEDAFTTRAVLYRLKEDNSSEVISFNLADVISGKDDIILKREDLIEINSKLALREEYSIIINGAVLKPGKYAYSENAHVEDIIIAAGGLRDNASLKRIEIARRHKSNEGIVGKEIAEIINYEVTADLISKSTITLMPYDIITVFNLPGYVAQNKFNIEGEVNYPGSYSISNKTERISDAIKRAGGVTNYGFVGGAVLIRTKKLSDADNLIRQQKIDALTKQTKDEERLKEIIDKEVGNLTSIVGIDLEKILKNPGSKYDLLLSDGDLISVPSVKQTVKVSGEILYPVSVPYTSVRGLRYYVNRTGGYTHRALRKKCYVVYANGSAKATKNFILFKAYPKIKPGSEIIVPTKEERKRVPAVEIVGITSSIATLAVLIVSVLKK